MKHEEIKYDCDQCDGSLTRQYGLTIHKQSKHEEIIYYCDQCDDIFTWHDGLTIHKQSKHEGIRCVWPMWLEFYWQS